MCISDSKVGGAFSFDVVPFRSFPFSVRTGRVQSLDCETHLPSSAPVSCVGAVLILGDMLQKPS